MKKLQNTLYITRDGVYLHKENETIVVDVRENDRKVTLLKIPVHAVSNVFCFGNILVSPQLLGFCGEKGIQLSFFNQFGKFQARVVGCQTGNILLRQSQYDYVMSNDLMAAKNIVAAKIRSSRNFLMRFLRTYEDNLEVKNVSAKMLHNLRMLQDARSKEELLGIEGEAARNYFSVFNLLIRNKDFSFDARTRRPPKDPVNSLLSFLYSIFAKEISGALQGVGLDPQMGVFHMPRPGRDSLALDLLEEFRSPIIDRFVLSIINRGQISLKDFESDVLDGVYLKNDARRSLLQLWQAKKQEEIIHPFLKEKINIGLLPHVQSMLLARFLRKDIDNYPPFVSK